VDSDGVEKFVNTDVIYENNNSNDGLTKEVTQEPYHSCISFDVCYFNLNKFKLI